MKQFALSFIVAMFFSASNIAQLSINIGQSTHQITIGNITREFITYIPKGYNSSKKSPIIFLFHGGGAHANSMLNICDENDFKTISEQQNVILVAPEGIDKSWNDGRETKSNKQDIDDVGFISQLITYMENNYSVDASRIYATGISNGGFMTSRLGCEIGNKFAAIAVVAATMGTNTPYATCSPTFSLPVMYIHGTNDPIVHFNGGEKTIGAQGSYVSHKQVIDKWIAINQCNQTPVKTELPKISKDEISILKEEYKGGKNGAEIISYTIVGGGHTWPGGKQYLPKMIIGKVSHDMNACQTIWDFFNENKR